MLPEVNNYLDEVRAHLHLSPAIERQVVGEFYTHFQERVKDLRQQGLAEGEATLTAIDSFGRARVVARLMYEACSKGSWTDAAMAGLPHLIVAGLFAAHLWQYVLPSSLAFAVIVGVTLLGWWRGKPNWLYSWMGYSLIPILVIGYTSWYTTPPNLWVLGLVLIYYGLAVWLIVSISIRVVRRDWILASFLLAPLPIVGCWLFNIQQTGVLFRYAPALGQWDMAMALAATVLAITSAAFIRLRPRALKVGAVITVSSVALAMVADRLWGNVGFFGLLAFSLVSLVFLSLPALLRATLRPAQMEKNPWGDYEVDNPPAGLTEKALP
jgi:hypothetical protein